MSPTIAHRIALHFAIPFLMIVLTSTIALGQAVSQYDRGTPPQLAGGVSSFGSYTTADLGNVNLSNGSLNMAIPLGTVGGRGFSIPLTLNYSSKVWSVSKDVDYVDGSAMVPYASYGAGGFLQDWHNRITPGWTVGIAPILHASSFGIDPLVYPGCGYSRYITKLTISMPDKGEIELRDDYTDGAPHLAGTRPNTGNCKWYDQYRGRRWHAADGSGIIFISDVDNAIVNGDMTGVLITADGMRYRFENATVPGPYILIGRATSITDRNGNVITITYPSTDEVDYTDQLNRVTKIKKNVNDPQTGVPLVLLVELPGYGGTRYYKVKAGQMAQNYRAGINPGGSVITGLNNPQSYNIDFQGLGSIGYVLFPESYCLFVERLDYQAVVSELVLPDNRSLLFKYNVYGEVAEVQLPTGGKMQYDYEAKDALPTGVSLPAEVRTNVIPVTIYGIDRALVARRTYADGTNLEGSWTYTYTGSTTEVRAFSATGTLLRNERHVFMPAGRYIADWNDGLNGTGYSLWSTGLESRSELRNASNVVMSATETDWTQRASVSWWTGYTQQQPANDNRINQTRRYLETGAVAKVETFYDQYNNRTEVKEYDYDQTLKRRTVIGYLNANNGYNYQTDDSIHLLRLPVTQTAYDGGGNQRAQTVTEYDSYTDDGNRDLLTNYASVSQHDSNYGTTKTTRGNPTRIGGWLNTTGGYIYTYPRYDILGNAVSAKDTNGNVTTISFADDFGGGSNPGTSTQNPTTPTYALPTMYTSPPPLPGAAVQTARSQYDYATGLLTGFRDRNNVVTQTIYNDPFNRPTQVKSALGITGVETHVATYYAPATVFGITLAKNDILTASDLNTIDDGTIRSWTVTDGFGRTQEMWKRDPSGDVKVITIYDGLGRVKQTSNPFRPPSESPSYTSTAYDLAGRRTSVTTPDNAVVSTSYTANTVTVTDQAGKARKSVLDALGRLVEVYEDPNGLNYQTSYLYDTQDNLVKVTQGSQQRFFMYDSLKRLIRSRNPEQITLGSLALSDPITGNSAWSIAYQYDASGNLTQKTDARGVVSTYAYDAFNRNTTIDYSDTVSINPDVKRFYDGAVNGAGRFWYFYSGGDFSNGSNVEATAFDSYDALGRPLVKRQLSKLNGTWGETYQTSRIYNLAGGVTSQTYPSGHTVSYAYDIAGRASSFSGNLGDGTTSTYATAIDYDPFGGIRQEQFGTQTPLYHKKHYNKRGQLFDTRLSTMSWTTDQWNWNRGALVNYYSSNYAWEGDPSTPAGPDNNGNVLLQQHWVPGDDAISSFNYTQDFYAYDALNRIQSAAEYHGTGTSQSPQDFAQIFTYDRWGNRTINPSSWGIGINTKQFTVDAATNRLGVPAGQSGAMSYDNAGNLTTDTYTGAGARTYDADNRMLTATDNTNQTSRYTYDADGNRVRRQIGSNPEQWQVYGMDGELLAEYPVNGPPTSPQKEYGYRNGQLLITAEPGPPAAPSGPNFASASNGATATASSTYSGVTPANANNGDHLGTASWWADNTSSAYPDWVQVDFAGSKTVSEIDVYGLQQNYGSPVEPTPTLTSSYALTNFEVQYWNGSAWATVTGGSVTGNDKVWRKFTFTPLATSKIRVYVTNVAGDNHSQLVELEAYGPLNVAAASNGATATASSTYTGVTPANTNNGDHVGTASWWADNTSSAYPDWLQVDFAGSKTINEIDVYGLQQNYGSPVEPTSTLTSSYALTNFEVQYWTGSAWATVPGGSVTGNDKVWRKFTFAPLTTSKVRVYVTNVAGDNRSQVVELEAYTGSSTASIKWLVADHLGTPRMIVDQSGALSTLKRHDYLPFGEELFAGAGGRTASQGYAPDGVRQQFTQKERDFETGLDSFGARYYASMQGRFTSVDPGNAGADLDKPQSWNGYAYALNNPLRFIDPDGLRWAQAVVDGAVHYQWFDDKVKDDNGQTEYDRAIAAGWTAVKFNESKNYTFVDGLLAPWETVRIVTLTTDGRIVSQTYTISYTEWTALLYWNSKIGGVFSEKLATDFFLSRFADKVAPDNPPSVPAAATSGIKLTPSEAKKLGGLSNRAGEKVSEVIRSRGGNASNVREAGPWAEKTLAETAKAAVGGDKTAETAIKIAKQAGRLGQK